MSRDERRERAVKIGKAFTPAAPVQIPDLFAGRVGQMGDLVAVTHQIGQHAVVYGERGVGKTSLVSIMHQVLDDPATVSVRVNCDGTDKFASVWRKVFDEIQFVARTPKFGFTDAQTETIVTAAHLLSAAPTPNEIKNILRTIATAQPVVVFIDEFDSLTAPGASRLFAHTIKTLSDNAINATIVIVGVADTVDDLISEHRSIERNLDQIPMPRMSQDELAEIIERGLKEADMAIDPAARGRITQLSQGLPHYTHLLGKASALEAVDGGAKRISEQHVETAVARAIRDAQQSIISAYQRATHSSRETLYPQVVLAAALCRGDDLGYFAASDLRAPLSRIMSKPYDIPAFSTHLNQLSSDRGPILQKAGTTRRFRFRFLNPLLQPYVIMKGLSEGLIDTKVLAEFTE